MSKADQEPYAEPLSPHQWEKLLSKIPYTLRVSDGTPEGTWYYWKEDGQLRARRMDWTMPQDAFIDHIEMVLEGDTTTQVVDRRTGRSERTRTAVSDAVGETLDDLDGLSDREGNIAIQIAEMADEFGLVKRGTEDTYAAVIVYTAGIILEQPASVTQSEVADVAGVSDQAVTVGRRRFLGKLLRAGFNIDCQRWEGIDRS